ncbi:hypothetical protein ACFWSF_23545 [Streptomyces sp. NPDC058611]|uniref:hypothetical protein n=1 Tax=unclassified Streptomyces TaxID=2593676 RepID=UPI00365B536B
MTLRVLFALLPILSCGFLAWGSMLRLALVTRKTRDWVLLLVSGGLAVLWMTLIQLDPTAETNGWQGNLGAGGTILTAFAVCVYFLVADIKHYEAKSAAQSAHWYGAQPAPYLPPHLPQQPQQSQGYGYPHQAQASRAAQSQNPAPPQQPPHATSPPRIGQVRAELDELSELLRNQPPRDEDPTR